MKLKDKVFIITGAASGMGKETALRFEEEGAYIVAVDRNEAVITEWEGHEKVTPIVIDITDLAGIKQLVQTVRDKFSRLDGVCNIAGINDLSYPLLETDDERWDKVMDIDLKAPFRILREAIPLMVESGGGSIVNIGSYAALRGNHGPSYTAAKAGLGGLTKSIAFGFAKQNIRCNIIHPGACATGLTMGGQTYHEAQAPLTAICQAMPVKWFGVPQDIAKVCAFLCSDDAAWVNGAVISVDGGMAVC